MVYDSWSKKVLCLATRYFVDDPCRISDLTLLVYTMQPNRGGVRYSSTEAAKPWIHQFVFVCSQVHKIDLVRFY